MIRILPILVVFVTVLGAAPERLRGQFVRSVALEADNDNLNVWAHPDERPDEEYTHGARLRFGLDWHPLREELGRLAGPPCDSSGGPGPCRLTFLELGQAIFLPVDPRLPSVAFVEWLTADHRQPAGWLYLGLAARLVGVDGFREAALQIGVTGPPSHARQTLEWFHERQGYEPAIDWEGQLPFEVGVNARYRERRSLGVAAGSGPVQLALEPEWGVSLGNVRTAARLGVDVRLAANAPRPAGWGVPRSGPFLYVVAGVGMELVLRDVFLDGSTFGGTPQVSKEPFVPRRELGVGLGWSHLLLEFRVKALGDEFRDQLRPHTYSSMSIRTYW